MIFPAGSLFLPLLPTGEYWISSQCPRLPALTGVFANQPVSALGALPEFIPLQDSSLPPSVDRLPGLGCGRRRAVAFFS